LSLRERPQIQAMLRERRSLIRLSAIPLPPGHTLPLLAYGRSPARLNANAPALPRENPSRKHMMGFSTVKRPARSSSFHPVRCGLRDCTASFDKRGLHHPMSTLKSAAGWSGPSSFVSGSGMYFRSRVE
jgi:hypothetical protein